MDFSDALQGLKDGKMAARKHWNGPGQFVLLLHGFQVGSAQILPGKLRHLTEQSATQVADFAPYLVIRTVQGQYVPWQASQGDLLAEDWELSER